VARRDVGYIRPAPRPRRRPRPSQIAGPPTPRPHPVGVFAHPVPRREPIQRQVVRAQRRTRAAQRRLPQRPLPHVPIIRHPTPRQTQAAKRIITGAIRHAVGPGGSGADRLERRRQVEQELRSTGPGYQLLRAARHYARWERRHTEMAAGLSALQALPPPREPAALHRGLLYGFDATTRPPTRTEIRAIGRGVLQDRMVRDRVSPGVRKSLQGRGLAAVLAQTSLGSPSAENQFLKSAAE
jgi:GNAT superfamily N-acetyltransferase